MPMKPPNHNWESESFQKTLQFRQKRSWNSKNKIDRCGMGKAIEFVDKIGDSTAERYWLTNKFSFRDQSGQVFVGGISLDITDSIHAEEILRRTEQLSAAGYARNEWR